MVKPIQKRILKAVAVVSLVAAALTGAAFAPGHSVTETPITQLEAASGKTINSKFPESFNMIRTELVTYSKKRIAFNASELTPGSNYDAFYDQILATDPNRFFVKNWNTYQSGSVEFSYHTSRSEIKRMTHENEKEADRIIREIITPDQSDLEKIRVIHDYIAKNVVYDHENFKNGTADHLVYTSYGALNQGVAVCDGYTRAANQLLARVGIESHYVIGQAGDELHSWNLVKIDNEFYHMDVTWDDPPPDREENVRHTYFLIGDDQLSIDHQWVKDDFPKASALNYETGL